MLFEAANCGLFGLRADVAVVLQHLTADVSRERPDRLLADARALGEPGDERVAEIVPSIACTGTFTRTEPSLAPGSHWPLQFHVVNLYRAGVAADANLMEWEDKTVWLGIWEAGEPQAQTGTHPACEGNQSACACRRLALGHDNITARNIPADSYWQRCERKRKATGRQRSLQCHRYRPAIRLAEVTGGQPRRLTIVPVSK